MCSNIYEKDNESHEIQFLVWSGDLKSVKAPSENLNSFDFNEIKIILLMFTGSQDLYQGAPYSQKTWLGYT